MAGLLDFALRLDPASGHCDAVIEGGDFALDRTPVTSMLIALGSDRRARPDDTLPDEPLAVPVTVAMLGRRRGWIGDALQAQGARIGSRLWLLARAKQTEETRLRAIAYAEEGLAGLRARLAPLGQAVAVDAAWVARNTLGMRLTAGDESATIRVVVGA